MSLNHTVKSSSAALSGTCLFFLFTTITLVLVLAFVLASISSNALF